MCPQGKPWLTKDGHKFIETVPIQRWHLSHSPWCGRALWLLWPIWWSLANVSIWAQTLRLPVFWTLFLRALSCHVRSLEAAMLELPLTAALFNSLRGDHTPRHWNQGARYMNNECHPGPPRLAQPLEMWNRGSPSWTLPTFLTYKIIGNCF